MKRRTAPLGGLERAHIAEAMRAFPFLPPFITIPVGTWFFGQVLRRQSRRS